MARDLKYGAVTVEHDSTSHPLNGNDEPVFVIRARDKSALLAIEAYADLNPTIAHKVESAYDAFVGWRAENPELLKMAD